MQPSDDGAFAIAEFAADVRSGLTENGQKKLPSKYLYDDMGSSLFELICKLPEYGLTNADGRILQQNAEDIVERMQAPSQVAELGSGSGKKTRWFLEALCSRKTATYFPIEISRAAIEMCERELSSIDDLNIVGVEKTYLDGMKEVRAKRANPEPMAVLFLGSTLGNFEREEAAQFLCDVRHHMISGDSLLLGMDLEKPEERLLLAYNDPIGVTAAFNLNLLARMNRELDADFDLSKFEHNARYNRDAGRIEMHLCSRAQQAVSIRKSDWTVSFEPGETIWTESSHKFKPEEVVRMAEQTGFQCEHQWIDEEWPFAESLFFAA